MGVATTVAAGPRGPLGGARTFLANQTPLACVTHSREWMPVSIQMAGRFVPPLLNWKSRDGGVQLCPRPLSGHPPISRSSP